ncbi:hypothetical protein, partial [Ruminococcus champanellensis]|uniref:hypothetical protein n=1 Tax=Ruminococcus champanellensis TaxID=1161942 RepID=UPI0023F3115F
FFNSLSVFFTEIAPEYKKGGYEILPLFLIQMFKRLSSLSEITLWTHPFTFASLRQVDAA